MDDQPEESPAPAPDIHPNMQAAIKDLVSLITANVTSRKPPAGVYVIGAQDFVDSPLQED